MSFNTYFRASSYAMLATGALSLAASGGLNILLALAFACVLVCAWNLEDSRWHVPERAGLAIVLLSLPLFYLDWKYNTSGEERIGVAALAHLILFLSTIKLLQKKADRDWVFLYLISFFEVLLAAGLSISPLFLGTLGLYMLTAFSTVIAFEIKKAQRNVKVSETRLLVAPDATLFRRLTKRGLQHTLGEARRLPLVSLVLLVMIFAVALPLFFIAPRFGGSAFARGGGSSTKVTGFSETVKLGDIGQLQQSNAVVMRVRVERESPAQNLRWRGIALDKFDGRVWSRSNLESVTYRDKNLYQFEAPASLHYLTTQTFFIEPVDTPVLFAAPRAIAVQGALPFVRLDREGAITTRQHPLDRITYKAISDTTEPEVSALRADLRPYAQNFSRYLQLPENLDPRIGRLAREWLISAGARNRYDAARVIEQHLQRDYGYTLEMKAGGSEPLADFLFNVRAGHCEYFSTAMAVMLRTQGVAARVVNGFQRGEYNDAADVYTVTQKDAHSWVEVYFPETDSWVTFDPTPPDGRTVRLSTGLVSRLGKYAEAMELYWNQYVIGYDRQEQRSLATSLRTQVLTLREVLAQVMDEAKAGVAEWVRGLQNAGGLSGAAGARSRAWVLLIVAVLLTALLLLIVYRIRRLGFRRGLRVWRREEERASVVKFYERMINVLARQGMRREKNETPLEFAGATGISDVLRITRAYNRVRYGAQLLSAAELAEIEKCLTRLEGNNGKSSKE
jgi:transglutaminase-like putative cysteine protease